MNYRSDLGTLMQDANLHICDAIDMIVTDEKKYDGLLIYHNGTGNLVLRSRALKLCEAIYSVPVDIGRPHIFRTSRSIYSWLSCYHSKDYVQQAFSNGTGWLIGKPLVTSRTREYILERKPLRK